MITSEEYIDVFVKKDHIMVLLGVKGLNQIHEMTDVIRSARPSSFTSMVKQLRPSLTELDSFSTFIICLNNLKEQISENNMIPHALV